MPSNAIFLWKVFLWIIHPHGMNTSHLIPTEQVTSEMYYLKNVILFWNKFKYLLSHWILQKESPNQYVKLKVYLAYCRSHPAHVDDVWPLSQLLGCSSNQFYFGGIKNSILEKLAIPKFCFRRDSILWFVHTSFFQVLMETFDVDSATILKAIGSKVTMKVLTSHDSTKWRKPKLERLDWN